MKVDSFIKVLNNNANLSNVIIFTPFLYAKNRGFTIWNIYNILLSLQYPSNDIIHKFNANNTAAIFFGSLTWHLLNQKYYYIWLEKENYSMSNEKITHIIPFIYYYYKGYYNTFNFDISILSLIYELIWTYTCGEHLFNKQDIYYKMEDEYRWYIVWTLAFIGQFFNIQIFSYNHFVNG